MSPETVLRRIIKRTERILPGRPAPDGEDDRWQAIIQIGYHIPGQPEPIWEFVRKWGKHPQKDLRMAVATLLLEHLLEHHFELIYPRVCAEAKASNRFRDTLRHCWWMGEAALPTNARKLDRIAGVKRRRVRPGRPATSRAVQPNTRADRERIERFGKLKLGRRRTNN
jgi:hypothetical protein